MTNIDKKIKAILEEDITTSSNALLEKEEAKTKRAGETKEELFIDADKIRFINDTRAKSIPAGLVEEFKKICDCNPRGLSSKELDTKFKKVQEWAKKNLEQKEAKFGKPEELKTKKENIMVDEKLVIKEADERIKNAFNTLILAKKALEEAETQLTMNLGYHFIKLYNDKLTTITEEITAAKSSITSLAQEIHSALKV